MSGVVIVGSSVAGVRTAQSLRSIGYRNEIIVIGEESELPYDRPPLSKDFLSGITGADEIRLISAEAAAEADIKLRLGEAAVGVDTEAKVIQLAGGDTIPYDKLVLATGARARPSPWQTASGLHVLRSLGDAQRLREDLLRGGELVIVGAGFIGAEIASTAQSLGLSVTMIDPQPIPMSRVLNEEVGNWFAELHGRHGVRSIFGVGVEDVTGRQGELVVRLSDGAELAADTVVVGIGAVPNTEWLSGSGLEIENGVVCDEYCRAQGVESVFAVGDVARWRQPHSLYDSSLMRWARAEHWTNAVDQAACVAHNIVYPGEMRAYNPTPYVWSDQYDWKVQIVGRTGSELQHSIVDTGGVDEKAAALYGDDEGRLVGAAVVNWPKALIECRRALAEAAGASVEEMRTRVGAIAR